MLCPSIEVVLVSETPQRVHVRLSVPVVVHPAALDVVQLPQLCPGMAIVAVSIFEHLEHFRCFVPAVVQVAALVVVQLPQLCPSALLIVGVPVSI